MKPKTSTTLAAKADTNKRVLYLRVEVEAPLDSDPLLSLSDAATWAEVELSKGKVTAVVTAFNSASDLAKAENDASLPV